MSRNENTIRWHCITGFEMENISYGDIVYRNLNRFAGTNDLDLSIIFLFEVSKTAEAQLGTMSQSHTRLLSFTN